MKSPLAIVSVNSPLLLVRNAGFVCNPNLRSLNLNQLVESTEIKKSKLLWSKQTGV
ncbi:hypothetical protein [Nostoc sp.]|uniref:hypothetical protein n=1 Tax=Nostoc sp. TaxID=1180 RepID=UPI002FF68FE3